MRIHSILVSLTITILAMTPLAACNRAAEEDAIVYWRTLTGRAGEAQDELASRYNASGPTRPVRAQFQGGYGDLRTKLLTALAGGGGPDITQLGSFEILEFARAGALVDLQPFVDGPDGIDLADWPGTLADSGRVEGGLYWLPFNVSVPILYYNAEAFTEAGLDGPPETWDDFFEAARRLTVVENGRTMRYGLALWDMTWPIVSAIWSEGGMLTNGDYSAISLDHPAAIAVLTRFQELVKEGAAILPEQAAGGHRAWFTSGRAAMILDSPAPYADITRAARGFNVRTAQYPAGTAGRVYAPGGGGIAILASCPEHKRADAWRFVRYLLEAENLAWYATESGYAPFTASARAIANDSHPEMADINGALAHIQGDFSLNMSPALRDAFDRAFMRIMLEGADVGETLRTANAEAARRIARDGL